MASRSFPAAGPIWRGVGLKSRSCNPAEQGCAYKEIMRPRRTERSVLLGAGPRKSYPPKPFQEWLLPGRPEGGLDLNLPFPFYHRASRSGYSEGPLAAIGHTASTCSPRIA